MFIRVKDKDSGHEFDVPESDWRIGESLVPVKSDRFPAWHQVRPPKFNIQPIRASKKEES
jgi:hypothetical protein